MNCQRAREIFPELLDGRTLLRHASGGPADPLDEARTHLATCPECQREFAALGQTATALDTMPVSQPSPRLRQNFYAMLEQEKHSVTSVRTVASSPTRSGPTLIRRWAVSLLGASALLALGFAIGQRTFPQP